MFCKFIDKLQGDRHIAKWRTLDAVKFGLLWYVSFNSINVEKIAANGEDSAIATKGREGDDILQAPNLCFKSKALSPSRGISSADVASFRQLKNHRPIFANWSWALP